MPICKIPALRTFLKEDALRPSEEWEIAIEELAAMPTPPDYDRGLRATIDYERSAHRKTTELLIEKDQQVQQAMLECAAARRERDLCKAERNVAFGQWKLEEVAATEAYKREMRAHAAIELCIPIVRDLFEFTSDYKLHASCKAALAAYEELFHAATTAAAPDPVPVGDAPARHLSDCQAERPQGVPSGQLPGPTAREGNGAAPGYTFTPQYSGALFSSSPGEYCGRKAATVK